MLEYAAAVINVLEKNIFDRQDQQRLLNSPNREEAFKVLFDTDLAEAAAEKNDLESIFEEDLLNLKNTLEGMLRDDMPELFYFLFLKFDALNLKMILKEKEDFFFACSLVHPKKLLSKSKEQGYVEEMVSLALEEEGTIDERVDKAYLKTRLKIAQKLKDLPLDLAKFEIDIANLKNAIKDKEAFVCGGNLSQNDTLKILGKRKGLMISRGLERFLEAFDLSIIIKEFENTGSESDLEKGLEKFLAKKVFQREMQGGGMEKVIGFFFRKMNAQSNIKLILFQKDSDISLKEIEKNLLPLRI